MIKIIDYDLEKNKLLECDSYEYEAKYRMYNTRRIIVIKGGIDNRLKRRMKKLGERICD